MGCTYSGQRKENDGGVRSFRVHNVDDQGVELNRGTIEVKDNDLVLYQKGKEPIRWPLRCLRRYGFDAELFSFESGRRCAMGPGIYAFKCTHAEALFNLVYESIQRAGEEDQRGQQHSQHPGNHAAPSAGTQHSRQPAHTINSGAPAGPPESYGAFMSNGMDQESERPGGGVASAQLYVNGIVVSEEAGHEYVNTGPTQADSGAFQIDETAALIDFLHNPPGIGGGASRSQVNYTELCMPDSHMSMASMENLLDETGQGAIHNVDKRMTGPDLRSCLSQNSLSMGSQSLLSNRISMPNDLLAGASQDNDSVLQSADSDVFLADAPPEGLTCPNYVNIAQEEVAAAAAAQPLPPPAAAPPPIRELVFPPSRDIATNYANLALQPPRASKACKQVNYIVIDHKNQSNDNIPSGAGNTTNSPSSPISSTAPDSPSRKTESYAMIDFNRTVALSNTTRPVEDEGGRKTRHNSTISDMP